MDHKAKARFPKIMDKQPKVMHIGTNMPEESTQYLEDNSEDCKLKWSLDSYQIEEISHRLRVDVIIDLDLPFATLLLRETTATTSSQAYTTSVTDAKQPRCTRSHSVCKVDSADASQSARSFNVASAEVIAPDLASKSRSSSAMQTDFRLQCKTDVPGKKWHKMRNDSVAD